MPNNPASYDAISFPGFDPLKLSTFVPTYGKWCGPGWSAGQRVVGQLTEEQKNESVEWLIIDGKRVDSQVDTACKAHDLRYGDAIGAPYICEGFILAQCNLRFFLTNFEKN